MDGFAWPNGARRAISIAVAGVETNELDATLEALRAISARATFFVSPTIALQGLARWQALVTENHEIGNGCLIGASDDGDLPNWTLRMVEQELFMAQSFLEDFFTDVEATSFLYPGRSTTCSQGSYRGVVDAAYTQAALRLEGVNGPNANLQSLLTCAPDLVHEEGWAIPVVGSADDVASLDLADAWVAPIAEVAARLRTYSTV